MKPAKRGKQRVGGRGFVSLSPFHEGAADEAENRWCLGFISSIPSPQQKGKAGHENARPFVISMKEWFILVATSQR